MVNYYLKDSFLHNEHKKNAGNKARDDAEAILISAGYRGLALRVENWYEMNFLKAQEHKYRAMKAAFDQLGDGDELLIQFPIIHFFIDKASTKKGCKTISINP